MPDLQEMTAERGISIDHSTIHRWVVYFRAAAPGVLQSARAPSPENGISMGRHAGVQLGGIADMAGRILNEWLDKKPASDRAEKKQRPAARGVRLSSPNDCQGIAKAAGVCNFQRSSKRNVV